ncbi:hypothetical protein [Rhodococcoides fascians]|uniref:hypothetical protein n=1 Tax=Rhodococcoides fascians TaxID=1828 RepID=UPI0006908ED4|nr:hypothetical protein [Rhodococcus fascians]
MTATLSIRGADDSEWHVIGTVGEVKFSPAEVFTAPAMTTFSKYLTWTNPFLPAEPTRPTIRQALVKAFWEKQPRWQVPDYPFDDWPPTYEPPVESFHIWTDDTSWRPRHHLYWRPCTYFEHFNAVAHRITTAEHRRWLIESVPDHNHYRLHLLRKAKLTLAEFLQIKPVHVQWNSNIPTGRPQFTRRGRH